MEKEEKKEFKVAEDEYLKLKKSSEKKKAIIVIISFAAILLAMVAILLYLGIINNCQCEKCEKGECKCENVSYGYKNSADDQYKIFSSNLKNKILGWPIKSYLASDGSAYYGNDEFMYKIILTNKMQLIMTFVDEQYQKKYGEKIIADNVISFAIAQSGPGGYQNVYFIKEDGTVGEAVPMNLFDETINKLTITYPIKDLKNIVSIVTASYQDVGYMQDPVFIDINGNVYEAGLSSWD